MRALFVLVFVAGVAFAAPPKGKNLSDAEGWRESEELLKRNEKSAEQKCGPLTIGYDEKSFGALSLDEAKPADVYCRDAYNALWGAVCGSAEGKAAVKAKVTGVVCRLSSAGTKVTLEGKNIVIHVDPKKKELDGAVPGGVHWSRAIKAVL